MAVRVECRITDAQRMRASVSMWLLVALTAVGLAWPLVADAQDVDLPGRVGRVAEVAGELFLAPQDQPVQWNAIGLNYPVAAGDNVWVGADGRAEIDIGAGQFRLAANTSLLLSRLDDRQFGLFIAQGRVSVRVRVLDPGETAQIDTPNAQIVLTRPGLYRIDVTEDGQRTVLGVREGQAALQTGDQVAQVLPGQTATADGRQPTLAEVVNGIRPDELDAWVASRERYYDRSRANSFVSRQMVGWADLEEYGTWEQRPEYGAVWYPSGVAADWAPYRDGYWTEVGGWGPTWVDSAPWGYAPFHYGRWAHVGGRWGWCPGAYVVRPAWAPALVAWTGGPGWSASISGGPVYGWIPLAWGEAYRPSWRRCSQGCWDRYNRPYAVDVSRRPGRDAPPLRYANLAAPGGLTAVSGPGLLVRQPVRNHRVDISQGMRSNAPILADAPRVVAEPGRILGRIPGDGAPPPASTFYPTLARPGDGPNTLPSGAADTRVLPARAPAPGAPTGIARPVPGLTAPFTTQGEAPMRPAPAGWRPAGIATTPPVAGITGMAPISRPAAVAPAPPPAYMPAPAPTLSRPATRPQGIPMPPSLGAVPPPMSAPPAMARPAPMPPASQPPPPQYQLSRPAPVAPSPPGEPGPRSAQVAPPPPAAAPGGGEVRSRPGAPPSPVPERLR